MSLNANMPSPVTPAVAFEVATSSMRKKLQEKAKKSVRGYILYYGNTMETMQRMHGLKVSELKKDFNKMGGAFRVAMVVKKGDSVPSAIFNRSVSNSWTTFNPAEREAMRAKVGA